MISLIAQMRDNGRGKGRAGRLAAFGKRPAGVLDQGFTVIELLIVVSILAVVVGALGACLASGLRVWERAAAFNAVESEALIGLEIMEKDVMNSFVFHGIVFDGRSEEVLFAGLASQFPDSGQSAQVLSTPCRRIGTIKYSFNEKKKRLFRKAWLYPSEEPDEMETIAKNVDRVELRYLSLSSTDGDDSGDWKNSWGSATNLPDGVSIDMVFDDEGKEMRFRRLVMLPHSR